MRLRLYVDESGDHTYRNLEDVGRRYLGLIGVAIEADYYRNEFQPGLESFKQLHFPHNPDEPVILHREDIYNRRHNFGVLRDIARNDAWEHDFIEFVQRARFQLITVVIDKKAHRERYGDAAEHPYHLCLTALLERYRGHLKSIGGKGDVLAESRGAPEDLSLEKVYKGIWEQGTFYIAGKEFRKVLTTKELKVKKKKDNIAGLQLADLLAHPATREILTARGKISPISPSFGAQLAEAFRSKYDHIGRKLFD
ncbi:DUF3800 domain-containing protein [Chloroflexota bacterium]